VAPNCDRAGARTLTTCANLHVPTSTSTATCAIGLHCYFAGGWLGGTVLTGASHTPRHTPSASLRHTTNVVALIPERRERRVRAGDELQGIRSALGGQGAADQDVLRLEVEAPLAGLERSPPEREDRVAPDERRRVGGKLPGILGEEGRDGVGLPACVPADDLRVVRLDDAPNLGGIRGKGAGAGGSRRRLRVSILGPGPSCKRITTNSGRLYFRRATVKGRRVGAIGVRSIALVVVLGAGRHAMAQDAKAAYSSMAPLDQYLMEDRSSEIALARSAAPESISRDAEIMVLGRHGYETAVKGKNDFVCLVERSWTAPIDDANFWNPKLRGPICLNAAAARSYLPRTIRKTALVVAGHTKAQMVEAITAAIDKHELPAMEPGAMCYMLSKQGYLSDRDGHWHPHLMFFASETNPAVWGADLPSSPVLALTDTWERLTTFLVPVRRWSDGTAD